jgi:hypothetical protein
MGALLVSLFNMAWGCYGVWRGQSFASSWGFFLPGASPASLQDFTLEAHFLLAPSNCHLGMFFEVKPFYLHFKFSVTWVIVIIRESIKNSLYAKHLKYLCLFWRKDKGKRTWKQKKNEEREPRSC